MMPNSVQMCCFKTGMLCYTYNTLVILYYSRLFILMCDVDDVSSCISEAWAVLKRGHTDSDDMVAYFLQACSGLGLCAKALKFIPPGYNVGESHLIPYIINQNIELWD